MKTTDKFDAFMLKGKDKKYGFDRIRYIFAGLCRQTGVQDTFFVELEYLNPLLSQKKIILGFSQEYDAKPQDLQSALMQQSPDIEMNTFVQPSFVCVKAGIIKGAGKQVANYFPYYDLTRQKKNRTLNAGKCVFSSCAVAGEVALSENHEVQKSAYLCNTGMFLWNLKFKKVLGNVKPFKTKELCWTASGSKTLFSGEITVDTQTYTVLPDLQAGYIEHDWGRNLPVPYFHINSSKLTSIITGKPLQNSFFCIYGAYNETLAIYAMIENIPIYFSPTKPKSKNITWDCLESPTDTQEKKLHWTSSFSGKNYILDVDIYCKETDMFMRQYEQPCGNRKLLKVLCGANGIGEIRLYRHIKKSMELIEHANIENCICEYGNQE